MTSDATVNSGGKAFLRGFGISLLAIAFVYLVVGVILRPLMPSAVHRVLDGVYDTLLCGTDEDYHQNPILRGALRRNIVGTGDAWCEDVSGQRRDISYSEFNVAIALFVIPLLAGMFFILTGAGNLPAASRPPSVFTSSAGGDLSSRLTELKSAYDKGLISQEEYEQTRANLLRQLEK
ncbi:MAG: SHOCT domain-containing protein [Chloroflexi bacterium]|nr:SHOCT domain-containing protein [Chloroflexota bacterium]MCC6893941.1 SHOCT domain-containing protein [Anaerolineae bacterium]